MKNTKYITATGKARNIKLLSDDLKEFYNNVGIHDIASFYQIQRVLLGDRFDFTVIFQIAFYLGISIKALTAPEISNVDIKKEQATHYMKRKKHINWQEYDKYLAPILERVADDIYTGKASENGRPERVSERLIYKKLNLPTHSLANLPKCKVIFNNYTETYEENWARRIIWAYNKFKKAKQKFHWSDIRQLTGVKKCYLPNIIPYIKQKASAKNVVEITRFLDAVINTT